MPALNQSGRRFFADGRNTRNIIRTVAHQSLDVNKLLRRHPVSLFDGGRRKVQNFGLSAAGFRQAYQNVAICKLQKIPVSRHHRYLKALLLVALCKSTDHIVRLVALERYGLDVHGRQQFL